MTRISASTPNVFSLPDPAPAQPPNTAAPHHRKHHRHGVHGHHHAAEQLVEEQLHHHKHIAQVAKRVRRPRTGKRSGAGSPEEPITDSTFEELLLMLEEHARKVEPMVIGLSSRQGQRDGDDEQSRDHRSAQGRRALLLQYLQEQAAETDSAAPQKAAAAQAGALPTDMLLPELESSSYQRLEQELFAVRHAMHTGHPMPLRMAFDILRSYLKQAPIEGTPDTLAAVKDRLLAATPQHAAAGALTDREKTFNLLFPLLLLSPSRPRIGRERGESIARSSAVARRWTTELWSYRAGLGLALPPLPDPSPQSP
ncbi:type III secretion protein HrpV [Ralstonia mojiangensis]|uniref:type III secretion protein HrpV n=1 Tax=Ralstonia mojiangensis TaxID=2953895 RepID=UPI0020910FA9|nr:type III secretion protein HrpV [Ralstonia mojiangensis]MCO5414800.1 type III secretion protein HrpV [Ralstonia mojiangensis]MCT7327544.1 type III secretion protein HrpV [Ralstonia mojiangensis]